MLNFKAFPFSHLCACAVPPSMANITSCYAAIINSPGYFAPRFCPAAAGTPRFFSLKVFLKFILVFNNDNNKDGGFVDNLHRPSSTSLFIAVSDVEGTYPPSTSFIAFIIFPKRTGGFHQVASHLSVMFPPNDRSLYASSRILRCSEKLLIAKASHATSALSLNAVRLSCLCFT